jgi:hypothetical protein
LAFVTRAVLPEEYAPGAEVRLAQMRALETEVHGCQRCGLAVGAHLRGARARATWTRW